MLSGQMNLAHDSVRLALASTRLGFQVIAPDWRYLYLNPAAASHGGKQPEELVGRTMLEAYPGIEHTPLFSVLDLCMTQRTSQRFENLFGFPDGSSRWFDIRVDPTPEGICVYSIDIHERKLKEMAAEQRIAALEGQRRPPWFQRLARTLLGR